MVVAVEDMPSVEHVISDVREQREFHADRGVRFMVFSVVGFSLIPSAVNALRGGRQREGKFMLAAGISMGAACLRNMVHHYRRCDELDRHHEILTRTVEGRAQAEQAQAEGAQETAEAETQGAAEVQQPVATQE